MDITPGTKEHIENVAGETLEQFENIAIAAQDGLCEGYTPGATSLANVNSLNAASSIQQLYQIGQSNTENFQVLTREPTIARVDVADEDGKFRTHYIRRGTPISGVPNMASYLSPVGHMASLMVGSEFTLPNGNIGEVIEQAQLRPVPSSDGWDSRDTFIEFIKAVRGG